MQKVLTIKENRVIVNEVILVIPAFRKAYDYYVNKDDVNGMNNAISAFTYLHFMYDPESPHFFLHEDFRREKVIKDCPGDYNPSFDIPLIEAAEKMKELCETPTYRYLQSLKVAMDNTGDYLRSAQIVGGKDGNLNDIQRAQNSASTTISNFNAVDAAFRQEVIKRKGASKIAIDEDDTNSDF
jgi:hypothetical protein